MKKKKNIMAFIIGILLITECFCIFLMNKSLLNYKSINAKEINNEKLFAVYLEQADGTYVENHNKWPQSGYVFDSNLSGCVNLNGTKLDGALTYDELNHKVIAKVSDTARCYLYFNLID